MTHRFEDRWGLVELGRDECFELLRQACIGRVGVTIEALPVILPVNYAVVDDRIVFRTVAGTKLAAATRHAVIAFEVDSYDLEGVAGWSVLAIGRASLVVGSEILPRVRAVQLKAWAVAEGADHYVQIEPTRLSGRRFDHRPPMVADGADDERVRP